MLQGIIINNETGKLMGGEHSNFERSHIKSNARLYAQDKKCVKHHFSHVIIRRVLCNKILFNEKYTHINCQVTQGSAIQELCETWYYQLNKRNPLNKFTQGKFKGRLSKIVAYCNTCAKHVHKYFKCARNTRHEPEISTYCKKYSEAHIQLCLLWISPQCHLFFRSRTARPCCPSSVAAI